jgi:uncharacterized membrane protein
MGAHEHLHRFGSFFCHQKKERSLHIKGNKMFVCARCTGIYSGFLLGFLCMIISGEYTAGLIRAIPLAILAAPVILDGTYQLLTGNESNNRRRFFTGILGGMGVASFMFTFYNAGGTAASPSNSFLIFAAATTAIIYFFMFYHHKFPGRFDFITSKATHKHLDWAIFLIMLLMVGLLIYQAYAHGSSTEPLDHFLARWSWI